jgi:hypothetical protein
MSRWEIFMTTGENNFQTDQSMITGQITHSQMKTKHWDVEADPFQSSESLIRFNLNRGGRGHACESKHENGRDRVRKVTFFVITRSLCDTRCFNFLLGGGVLLIPSLCTCLSPF